MRMFWVAAVLAGLLAMPGRADTVQVRNAAVRERPSFLGRVAETVGYGEQLEPNAARGPWIQVRRQGRILGWVHRSALTRRTVEFRSGDEVVDPTVSSDELALAGKGFSAEVEARYRVRHGHAGFRQLDQMEQWKIPAEARRTFQKEGGLTPNLGGQP